MAFVAEWPDHHVDALKVNFAAGMSFAQNAAALNATFSTEYSRNACISKAARIGLKQADKPKHKPETRRSNVVEFRCAEVIPLNLTILELQSNSCRWPAGEGSNITFCGHPKMVGSYCLEHYRLSVGPGTIGERAAHKVRESA